MNDAGAKPGSFEDYFAAFPRDVQSKLQEIRAIISSAAPEATEKISYAMPTYDLKGNLIHFAAHRNHLGVYPGPEPIVELKDELGGYHVSKGAIQFPLDESLPKDLIRRIVAACVRRNMSRKKGKKSSS